MSGIFEEIHQHGTRVVKVVYDDYEIIARNKKIVINASKSEAASGLDLTVNGAVKQKITGDYILDIGGNFIRRVGKSEIVKVGAGGSGNMETEILGSYNVNVNKNYIATIGNDASDPDEGFLTVTTTGKEQRTIGGTQEINVTSDISVTSVTASIVQTALQDFGVIALNDVSIVAGNETKHGSGKAVTINYEDNVTETIGGTLTQTVTGAVTETYESSLRTNISGTTGIKHSGVATYHYSDKFQERIEKEHEVTKLSGTDFDNFFTETSRTAKDPATEIAGL